jgi:hypothetical protein
VAPSHFDQRVKKKTRGENPAARFGILLFVAAIV